MKDSAVLSLRDPAVKNLVAHAYCAEEPLWVDVCGVDDVLPGTGAAALIGGEQVAIVRSPDGRTFYALSNFDPFSKAFVIARGIVGDRNGVPKIASPIYKQNFDLRSGVCLDDANVRLALYAVRVTQGRVFVAAPRRATP